MNFDVNASQSHPPMLEAVASLQLAIDSLSQRVTRLAQTHTQPPCEFLPLRDAWRHADTPSKVWDSPFFHHQVAHELNSCVTSSIEAESLKLALDVNLDMLSVFFEPNISVKAVFLKQFALCSHLIEAVTFYVNHNRSVAPEAKYGRSFPRIYFEALDATADLKLSSLIHLREKAGRLAGEVPPPKKKRNDSSSCGRRPPERVLRAKFEPCSSQTSEFQTPHTEIMNLSLSPSQYSSNQRQTHTFFSFSLPPRLVGLSTDENIGSKRSTRGNPSRATRGNPSREKSPTTLRHAEKPLPPDCLPSSPTLDHHQESVPRDQAKLPPPHVPASKKMSTSQPQERAPPASLHADTNGLNFGTPGSGDGVDSQSSSQFPINTLSAPEALADPPSSFLSLSPVSISLPAISLSKKLSISFSSEETVFPFFSRDPVSHLLRVSAPRTHSPLEPPPCAHSVRFSPSIRVYQFEPDSPVNFSFRKSQASLSAPSFLLPPSPHPPKDFHSVIAWLNTRDYEPPIELYAHSFFLPQGPHKHRSSHLHVPLKPIVQTTLNYEVLKEMSVSLPSNFSHTYHFLLSVLTDISLFQSLFVKKVQKLLPGRPSKLSRKDVESLVDWGVLVPRPRSISSNFFHFGFKVAKSDPSWTRFILDCSALNESQCDPPPFSLPPPICIISTILSSLFAFIADFCSWFFQHYVSPEVASFFSLRVGSSPYLCTRLAQGWKFSPVTGQSSSSVLAHDPMCPDDPRSLVWIDDLFFGDDSRENLDSKRQRFLQRCERAGATIGTISEIVTQFSYVGMDFDLEMKRWRVKSTWIEKFLSLLSSISSRTTPHIVWALLGGFMWFLRCSARPIALLDGLISQAVSLSPRLIDSSIGWSDPISLWPSATASISFLSSLVRDNTWRTILHPLPFKPPIHFIFSDASLKGGAAVFEDKIVWQTTWKFTVTSRDIFYLEALAWAAGVRTLPELGVRSATTVVDNEGLFHALLKSRAKDVRVGRIISDLYAWAEQKKFLLYAGWIDTKQMPADAPSRGEPLTEARPALESTRVSKWPFVFACDF